jgi:hypothetical protein
VINCPVDPSIAQTEDLANSMGLFLQKVNIIRDYYEDLKDGRTFYPEEIWQGLNSGIGHYITHSVCQVPFRPLSRFISRSEQSRQGRSLPQYFNYGYINSDSRLPGIHVQIAK